MPAWPTSTSCLRSPTEPTHGATAFLVEPSRPGFSVRGEHKLGIKESPTGSPLLEDFRVPWKTWSARSGAGWGSPRDDSNAPVLVPRRKRSESHSARGVQVFASDNAMKVAVEAVQVLGGSGYVTDYRIYEGTKRDSAPHHRTPARQ